jgi:hypothetical protein
MTEEFKSIIKVHKSEASPEEKRWKKFGEFYYKRKIDLVRDLASRRKYPDAPTEETHPGLFEKNPDGLSTYMGNPNVKGAYVNQEYTPEQLREYKRCMEDPIYFSETYVRIMSVDFGLIPFTLYPFQRQMVIDFKEERFNICKLPRQVGKSTTSVAFILWFVLFNPGKTVGILANKGELAWELLGRLQLAYESLPFWLQQGCITFNTKSMELENGSRILATTSSGSAARGMSFSLLFLDEFAFVPPQDAEEFFRSVYPTIASGSDTKMIIVSTPKGMNHFYRMWTEATQGRSTFKPTEIKWNDVPGRDDEWREQQIANTSQEQFNQEFNTEFIGSSSTLISPAKLNSMSYIHPVRKQDGVEFYEEPKPGHRYLITVDCAKGLRLDYSAFTVVDVTNIPYKLTAKFRSNIITPMIFPQFINNIGRFFNNAWVLVEVNDVGSQVAQALEYEFAYENLLRSVSKGRAGFQLGTGQGSKPGVTTSNAVKTKGCSNFKSLLETDRLIVEDVDVYTELTTFARKGDGPDATFAAEPGCNDDLVMCLVLFSWVVGSEYWKELSDTDPSKSIYNQMVEEDTSEMPLGFISYANMGRVETNGTDVWVSESDEDRIWADYW